MRLLTRLSAWRKGWESDARNSRFEVPTPFAKLGLMQESRGLEFQSCSTVYEFSHVSAAATLMFYDTTLIYVLRNLTPLPSQQAKGQYSAAERSAALEICRCIPYYSLQQSRSNSEHSPLVHWAVTSAWTTLSGDESAEGRCMKDLLNTKGREVAVKGVWAGSER